ncbi:MAG TPA: hypothetical protein VIH89_05495 [Candidatus Sulfotelmatobacter sp.]
MFNPPHGNHLHELHEGHLHRVGVFEHRRFEWPLRELVGGDAGALLPNSLMKKAKPPPPERRRLALRSVNLYVSTPWNIFETHVLSNPVLSGSSVLFWEGVYQCDTVPPSRLVIEIFDLAENLPQNPHGKEVRG